jgi:hypothetical protein
MHRKGIAKKNSSAALVFIMFCARHIKSIALDNHKHRFYFAGTLKPLTM